MSAQRPFQTQSVRSAAVAGRFYPDDPGRLRADVTDLLAAAAGWPGGAPKALIVPHAGYAYSGPTAASAFATLPRGHRVARVVLIGPSHHVPFRGVAVPSAAGFETPLGAVPVDRAAIAAVVGLPGVSVNDPAHAGPEHALEVELPFLQVRLGEFSLVPLLVGEASPQLVASVLGALWGGDETLIVISSDLSHFLPYEAARRLDAATAAGIEANAWAALGPANACGYLPIAGLLIEAGRVGLQPRRLALCNSGDTGGPGDRVVGYGAWAV